MMKRFALGLGIVALAFGAAACTSTSVMRLKDFEQRPPSARVDVYTAADKVGRAYAEIAVVSVDDRGVGAREQTLVDQLVKKAQEIGADGLILQPPQISSGDGDSRTVTRGIAIVYR